MRTGEKRGSVVGGLKCGGETDVDVEVIEVVEEEETGESDFLSTEETLENQTDLCVLASVGDCGREEREGEKKITQDLEVDGELVKRDSVGDLALGGGDVSPVMGEGEGDVVMVRSESDSVAGGSEADPLIERRDGDTEMAREWSSEKSESDKGMCY